MRAAWLAFGLLWALPAPGQDAVDVIVRFGLYASCQPMNLVIGDLTDDGVKIGLTKDAIEAAAESRLRAARLYKDGTAPSALMVSINVLGSAFSIDIDFVKWVTDMHGKAGPARTWNSGSTGTHGPGGKNYIMSSLSQHLDKFILRYLQVNEADCQTAVR